MAVTMLCPMVLLLSMLLCCSQAHEYIHPKSRLLIENLVVNIDPGVTISTDTTPFSEQRQKYVVKWQGVRNASSDDLIALYTPADGSVLKMLPVQFLSAASLDAGYNKTGSGQATFTVLNMRSTYRFALLRGGVLQPQLVAQTGAIPNIVPYQPTGGHLALHEDQRSVVVQWVSGSKMPQQAQWTYPTSAAGKTGVTELAPGRYRFTVNSSTVTYKMSQMCGYPANSTTGWLDPGYIHSAIIPSTTMIPGQRVYYRYGSEGSGAGWSKEHSFVAPMGPGVDALKQLSDGGAAAAGSKVCAAGSKVCAAGSKVASKGQSAGVQGPALKFLMFNDVAMTNPLLFNNPTGLSLAPDYGQNSSLLSSYLATGAESDAHLAFMVGDVAYAMGYGADWDVFGTQFEDAFTQWPMAVGTGNHERDWPGTGDAFNNTSRDSGGECNVPFTYRWYTPANPTDRPKQLNPYVSYYSFSQGPVHFLVLDSETPSEPQTPQGRFVASDLAAVDRSVTPWVVVTLHRMMLAPATYSKAYTGDLEVMVRLQKDYEELFHKYKVDAVVSGHEHAYARTCPVYRYTCAANAPLDTPTPTSTLLTPTGKAAHHRFRARAGGPVYFLAGHAGAGFTHGFPDPLPAWVAAGRQDKNGFLRFTATATQLKMEAVVSMDGSVMDDVTLVIGE